MNDIVNMFDGDFKSICKQLFFPDNEIIYNSSINNKGIGGTRKALSGYFGIPVWQIDRHVRFIKDKIFMEYDYA